MSDMTIADFWGIENVAPELNDNKGVSLVIVRSEKAVNIFEKCKPKLHYRRVSYEDGIKQNPSEFSSVIRPPERENFFCDMRQISFEELSKKYAKPYETSLLNKVKHKIKSILPNKSGDYGMLFVFYNNKKNGR